MKAKKLNFFSEHRIAFQKEINQHPAIQEAIAIRVPRDKNGEYDEGELVGTVLYFLGIEVDAVMSPEEMDKLYSSLTHKLRKVRTSLIIH